MGDKTTRFINSLRLLSYNMFTSQETANILEISKSTLLRYLKEQANLLEPGRQITATTDKREFCLDDLYAVAHYQKDKRPNRNFDQDYLENRIAAYGLSVAVTQPRRSSAIIQELTPIFDKNVQMNTVLDTYRKNKLV